MSGRSAAFNCSEKSKRTGIPIKSFPTMRRIRLLDLSIERIAAKVKRCRSQASIDRWQQELDGMRNIRLHLEAKMELVAAVGHHQADNSPKLLKKAVHDLRIRKAQCL
jgi:hypothetical protein